MSNSIYTPAITDGLLQAIKDIAHSHTPQPAEVGSPGFPFDYIVEFHGSITIIDPVSVPALQWLYKHLPDDCPRWGKFGFAVETRYVPAILEGLHNDGLYSESNYTDKQGGEV